MNIVDEDDNETWKTIYEAIYEAYFEKSIMCTDAFLELR